MIILGFLVLHWYLSLFFQTFFHHRYAAHSMFTMSKGWEKVFFIASFIVQGSSYLSPYAYAILHRLHHAHADTEKDPHSPKFFSNLFSLMWRTKVVYSDIFNRRATIEEKYKKNVPEWHSFERWAHTPMAKILWGAAYTAFYVAFATHWWMFLLLPIHFLMGPIHGAIINWFAHKYGYINFKLKDTSKNIFPVDILMLGEGFHNNHHKHSTRPNFAIRWFEFDPVYPVIKLFDKLRIIQLKGRLEHSHGEPEPMATVSTVQEY